MPAPSPVLFSQPQAPRWFEVDQRRQAVADELVRLPPLEVDDEADAAAVVLVLRVVEALGLTVNLNSWRCPSGTVLAREDEFGLIDKSRFQFAAVRRASGRRRSRVGSTAGRRRPRRLDGRARSGRRPSPARPEPTLAAREARPGFGRVPRAASAGSGGRGGRVRRSAERARLVDLRPGQQFQEPRGRQAELVGAGGG